MKQPAPLNPKERGNRTPAWFRTPKHDAAPTVSSRRTQSHRILAYLQTFSRWWVVILGCTTSGAVLGFLLTVGIRPVYRARTSLDIQTLDIPTIDSDLLATGSALAAGGAPSAESSSIQKQIKLLESTAVLDRTVRRLQSEPHPAAIDRDDLISRFARSLHLSPGNDLAYSDLAQDAARRIRVEPLGTTRLVDVTCDSWNTQFSAKFCNTLAEEFKAVDLETRGNAAQKGSDFLLVQVADVRQKLEDSQKKLDAAIGGRDHARTLQGDSVGEGRLRQLQDELLAAQADRLEKESLLRMATSAPPNSAELGSPIYRGYQHKVAGLKAKVARLVPPLTGSSPTVIRLRSQIHQLQAGMARQRAATVARRRNDFAAARHHEDLLNATYATLQASMSDKMSQTERVNLLRREVESEQQLYRTLLQRFKEVGLASSMQTTAIRVVDAAVVPTDPIWPRRGTATLVGLLSGLLFGLGCALFKERTANVFRLPGEAERYLLVSELGVIPSAALSEPRPMVAWPGAKAIGQPPALLLWNERFSIVAEAYRNATHSILLSGPTPPRSRAYIVASSNFGEGRTTITTNLGIAFSKSKLRVVIIDADLRNPGLHKDLLMENGVGLRQILRGEIDVATADLSRFCMPTVVPNLSMIAAGTGAEGSIESLHASGVTGLLDRLVREFDVVLIDTPPMEHSADARILAAHSDGVILVLRAGVTGRDQAVAACDLFEKDRVPLVGTILNDFNPARKGNKSFYRSYFQYRERIEAAEKSGVRR